ncbi:hypothetical protein JOE58_001907 [Curtobacterium luteum]|uniref:Uncharacterized protein n=1 Tax=Curtobacterium luteum TaxID=33881 RepID=A0A8H9GC87_9MICO|nr:MULTISPECIES: hypothetical protein [Curtobacterium]MBM7802656.1 hypothetical protein [Curtobacterium luteum]NUU49661.1 hypothetical protein [Curtobacterium luteum]GGL10384.1 hypothetical protein GCM10009769_30580 [Curtobacterium luteum]
MKKKIAAVLAGLALIAGGVMVGASPASAKECAYEKGAECTGWYPNVNTCKGIAYRGTFQQMRACEAWAGWGSHG